LKKISQTKKIEGSLGSVIQPGTIIGSGEGPELEDHLKNLKRTLLIMTSFYQLHLKKNLSIIKIASRDVSQI